jgi:hypothetical protein
VLPACRSGGELRKKVPGSGNVAVFRGRVQLLRLFLFGVELAARG